MYSAQLQATIDNLKKSVAETKNAGAGKQKEIEAQLEAKSQQMKEEYEKKLQDKQKEIQKILDEKEGLAQEVKVRSTQLQEMRVKLQEM